MTTESSESPRPSPNGTLDLLARSDCEYCWALRFIRSDSVTRFAVLDQLGLYCSAQWPQAQVQRIERFINALAAFAHRRQNGCPRGHTIPST